VPRRAVARVDVAALERNAARLVAAAAPASVCAVVKAGGYGHGACAAARAALAGGARWLAVAAAGEAAELREDPPLAGARVLVMGALGGEEVDVALAAGAEVVAWDERFVAALARAARRARRPGPVRVHVKLDTGMGRLGTRDPVAAHRVADAVAAAPELELAGGLTHFATADERGDAFFGEQLSRFATWGEALLARHPGVELHAANSAAILREPAARFAAVRPGVALYGLDPFGEDPAARGLEPALELRSWVAAVKPCRAGESAGYGRRFVAERDTWLATVPIGYGDGWRRALTNNADVLVRGRRVPLVGTVSMDNVTLDLGPGEPAAAVGDPVVLIGAQGEERILAEEVARRLDTINYEVTCALSPRVQREHHRGGAPA
jgi:alanine racemase